MRFEWLIKSAVIGIIAMLFICYIFSLAFSINARESQMMSKLQALGDNTVENLYSANNDLPLLAALGSFFTLLAGGMLAALQTRSEKASSNNWLYASAIVALITILIVDGYMINSWNESMQKYGQSHVDQFGRPVELTPLPIILLLMFIIDGACFLATTAGGLVVQISKASG